ncbi:AAA family ATPase, partial [Marinitoga arctica]
MKKLPIGVQDYKEIIIEDYIYVDKTKYIYELINSGKFYFLSRPIRFGKSLTVSTFYYLFKGEKELFKDTYIYDKWEFK